MGYEGRAVVVDPDVFAVGDVYELLTRDMAGKAIMCRTRTGSKGEGGGLATSVMLLECARLTHWRCEEQFDELFAGKRDYMDWILLQDEPKGSIGLFEDEWNDFDRLTRRPSCCTTRSARRSRGRAACRSTSPGRTRRSSP